MRAVRVRLAVGACLLLCVGWGPSRSNAIVKGPYVQNVTTVACTIMWELRSPDVGTVSYGTTADCPFEVGTTTPHTIHELALGGLTPDTVYYYRVSSGGVRSRMFTFRTAPTSHRPFRFVVYGDNRSYPAVHARIARLIKREEPDFVVHTGDLVNQGTVYDQWETEFFTPASCYLPYVPIFPTVGHHEQNAANYFRFFSLPPPERYYSFRWSNMEFFTYDCIRGGKELTDQIAWLEASLKASAAEWKAIWCHVPIYCAGGHGGSKSLRALVQPILDRVPVDLILAGDSHLFERTFGIARRSVPNAWPTIHITTGGGGAPLYKAGKGIWTATTRSVHHICSFHVDGQKLTMKAIDVDGRVFDTLSLDKSTPPDQIVYLEDIEASEATK